VKGKHSKYDFANAMDHEKKLNLMQIHLHEVKSLQIHNARPEFVKKISLLLTNQNPALLYSLVKVQEK
jgi:hypothetical protein